MGFSWEEPLVYGELPSDRVGVMLDPIPTAPPPTDRPGSGTPR